MRALLTIKTAIRRRLLRSLQPCREMVSLMSESMDRRLRVSEWLQLRLHLAACVWCARYLRQIKFLRRIARDSETSRPL